MATNSLSTTFVGLADPKPGGQSWPASPQAKNPSPIWPDRSI
ncbi:MAG: hypothetical protein WB779_05380 [Ignavibacteriaceae bacterium]